MLKSKGVLIAAAAAAVLFGVTIVAPRVAQAQGSGRVFEIRTYTCNAGKLPDLQKRFRDHTITIFNRHHMKSIGYWVPTDPPLSENTLIYILEHPSREAAKTNWDAFRDDPEWKKVQAESEANGKIVDHVVSIYAKAADYSAIK